MQRPAEMKKEGQSWGSLRMWPKIGEDGVLWLMAHAPDKELKSHKLKKLPLFTTPIKLKRIFKVSTCDRTNAYKHFFVNRVRPVQSNLGISREDYNLILMKILFTGAIMNCRYHGILSLVEQNF